MKDFLLDGNGDLYISKETADVFITDSIIQAITIRLRWFLGEWRINGNYGLPYYDEVFIKNPNTKLIASRIRKEILKVDEVDSVESVDVSLNAAERNLCVKFAVTVSNSTEEGEVTLSV